MNEPILVVSDGVVLDYDAAGRVLGIELLDVRRRVDDPSEVLFEMVGAHEGKTGTRAVKAGRRRAG